MRSHGREGTATQSARPEGGEGAVDACELRLAEFWKFWRRRHRGATNQLLLEGKLQQLLLALFLFIVWCIWSQRGNPETMVS